MMFIFLMGPGAKQAIEPDKISSVWSYFDPKVQSVIQADTAVIINLELFYYRNGDLLHVRHKV